MELRLTAMLATSPYSTPIRDSFASPSIPTTKPMMTTAKEQMVGKLTLDLSNRTLNKALKMIDGALGTRER